MTLWSLTPNAQGRCLGGASRHDAQSHGPHLRQGALFGPPLLSKEKKKPTAKAVDLFFWQGQKDSEPNRAQNEQHAIAQSWRTLLANCRRWQFAGFFIAKVRTNKNKRHRKSGAFCFWQGQKDSNPRPLVLETSTLPAELYPCTTRGIITHFFEFCKPFFKKFRLRWANTHFLSVQTFLRLSPRKNTHACAWVFWFL